MFSKVCQENDELCGHPNYEVEEPVLGLKPGQMRDWYQLRDGEESFWVKQWAYWGGEVRKTDLS